MAKLLSVSHDKVTRSLSEGIYHSKYLWGYVKPYVQELTQSKETVVLSFDDGTKLLCHKGQKRLDAQKATYNKLKKLSTPYAA